MAQNQNATPGLTGIEALKSSEHYDDVCKFISSHKDYPYDRAPEGTVVGVYNPSYSLPCVQFRFRSYDSLYISCCLALLANGDIVIIDMDGREHLVSQCGPDLVELMYNAIQNAIEKNIMPIM